MSINRRMDTRRVDISRVDILRRLRLRGATT